MANDTIEWGTLDTSPPAHWRLYGDADYPLVEVTVGDKRKMTQRGGLPTATMAYQLASELGARRQEDAA